MTRSELRRELRDRRRTLGAGERARLSRRISREVLKAIGPAPRGRRIAAYAALDEEVDVFAALATLARRGALLYLPRIASYRRRQLAFVGAALAGDAGELRQLSERYSANVALDGADDPVYLAPNNVYLNMVKEKYPNLRFAEAREVI